MELLGGVDRRFADLLDDREAIAAAILHPKFRDRDTSTDNRAAILADNGPKLTIL